MLRNIYYMYIINLIVNLNQKKMALNLLAK